MIGPSTMHGIDSGAASSMTKGEPEQLISSSPHPFEHMETQQDDDSDEEASISVLDPDDDDDEEESSWGFLVLVEAILYIPVLVQSLWASLPRSFLWGEAVLLLFEKRSLPGWFQRCQSVVCKIDSHMWPPPSFLLLVAFTITALVVHPDGFTWVIVEKTRKGALSLAEVTSTWWDIFINEHGAILSSILALATFAALFFLAYVLRKTLSPRRKQCESSDKKQGKSPPSKKKKRKGGYSRTNHRLGNNPTKSSLEVHDRADGSSTKGGEEASTGSSSPTLQHPPLLQEPKQEHSDDILPIYSSTQSATAGLPGNATHRSPAAADVSSVCRERSFSGESGETSNSRNANPSSNGTDLSATKDRGNKACFATAHTKNPPSPRKKNPRQRNARKLGFNDPKLAHDALHHSPARAASHYDTWKGYGATFSRNAERHEKQGSKPCASRATTQPRNNPSRTLAGNRFETDEIKSSQRIMPAREHDRWNTSFSQYSSASSNATPIVSPPPAFHYHNAGDSFSHVNHQQAYTGSTKQRPPTVNPMNETWRTTSANHSSHIPAPPGFRHPMDVPGNATIGMPLPAAVASSGSLLPMSVPSHPFSLHLRETDLHDIATSRVKENPFESSSSCLDQTEEDRIDAELQELGGRMVGSILDF